MSAREKLVVLSQQMADLTSPKCASECNVPHSCCDAMYCQEAIAYAKEHWGEELKETGHPRLPLMGAEGCTAPPHLRPICTIHVCEKHYIFDLQFNERYFDLREGLNEALYEFDVERDERTTEETVGQDPRGRDS